MTHPVHHVSEQDLFVVALVPADALGAIGWIGEPDPAVRVHDRIVRRIEWCAVEPVGEHGNGPIMFVADDLPIAVLAGDLVALSVEGVAVTVSGRRAEDAHVAVLFRSTVLDIVRDVAPEELAGTLFLAGPSSHIPPVQSGRQQAVSWLAAGGGWTVVLLVNRVRDVPFRHAPDPVTADRCGYCRMNSVSGWYGYWKRPSQV